MAYVTTGDAGRHSLPVRRYGNSPTPLRQKPPDEEALVDLPVRSESRKVTNPDAAQTQAKALIVNVLTNAADVIG